MEVLVPGFCWIPTSACVVGRGAIPVLVEVGEDLGVAPEDIQRKITPWTAALIVVRMCGAAADMDPIMEIARRHDLRVIEDCAQAGAMKYKGKLLGVFGDVGCFSLQQNKHFTSFTGGYVLCKDEEIAHAVNLSRDAGISRVMNVVSHEIGEEAMWGMGRYHNPLGEAGLPADCRGYSGSSASSDKF